MVLTFLEPLFAPDPVQAAVDECVRRVFARPNRARATTGLAALCCRRPGVARVPTKDPAVEGRVARAFGRRGREPMQSVGDLGSRRLGVVRG